MSFPDPVWEPRNSTAAFLKNKFLSKAAAYFLGFAGHNLRNKQGIREFLP